MEKTNTINNMKKIIFGLAMILLPVLLSAQVTLTADSTKITITRTGYPTAVLFTKDIKFGYTTSAYLFSDKSDGTGYEYTVTYAEITSYNGVLKAGAFPTFATLRTALMTFIRKGKSAVYIYTP